MCSGSPRPLSVNSGAVNDPRLSNDVAIRSSSAMFGIDHRSRCRPSRGVTLVLNRTTRRSGSANGGGRSSSAETTLNIVVVAPMPSASVRMATTATPRIRSSVLTAYRRSLVKFSIISYDVVTRPGVNIPP